MIIAAEEHYATEEMGQNLKRWEREMGYQSVLSPEVEAERNRFIRAPFAEHRLPAMQNNGISMQILSPQPPAAQALLDPIEELIIAERYNQQTQKLVQSDPAHFRGFAVLPMQTPTQAADVLERAIHTDHFVGAMIANNLNGRFLDDLVFEPLWDKLEELDVPIYIHVWNPSAVPGGVYEGAPWLLGPTWNWATECATHALRIIFSGVFDRHPRLKIMLGHLGEGLPFFAARLDEGARLSGVSHMKHPPSYYLGKNFYVTTSGAFSDAALRCVMDTVGVDKVIFACDYPFSPIEDSVACLNSCNLTAEEKDAICWGNAAKLFRIDPATVAKS